ncbi:hypothetical protein [Lutimonas zeaxanthinifaciens]|uniref:hypothetical protein n=1 Tax=Lutimonas zeaxanthinifaciens TaxID=3060215 RepID=UPI00265D1E35|nr:hypothetical protein [Lutimonas sp. YSD2104]WKK67554.1 hypothetical protein QZH61_07965 [Lutimonas sp. YSD2104]
MIRFIRTRSAQYVLAVVFILSLSSCELLNEEIEECINKIRPKLQDKTLQTGQVGVPYMETIDAYIRNADDDAFQYSFSLDGLLPSGLKYRAEGRTFIIYGTPNLAGSKEIKVRVELRTDLYGPGDGFCFAKDYDNQKYTITVLEAP